jgi:hypothetical protein
MANRIRFEFDPQFDENVYRASNKTRSSLRPLYDLVRKATDEIRDHAIDAIESEYEKAEQQTQGTKGKAYGTGKKAFLEAKARSFALRSARDSTFATMGFDGREIYGRVTMNRTGSQTLEFGGADPKAEVGKGTGVYIVHPAYSFLRRAMDREG